MSEPTTPTGKRLLGNYISVWYDEDLGEDDILAIEREAAQQERERLRADLAVIHGGHSPRGPVCSHCRVAHILLADPEDDA